MSYFTILYLFCHTSTWIRHGYTHVPHPEPPPTSLPIPSFKVFSNESALPIRWPKYWRFNFNTSPSSEYWGQGWNSGSYLSLHLPGLLLLCIQALTTACWIRLHTARGNLFFSPLACFKVTTQEEWVCFLLLLLTNHRRLSGLHTTNSLYGLRGRVWHGSHWAKIKGCVPFRGAGLSQLLAAAHISWLVAPFQLAAVSLWHLVHHLISSSHSPASLFHL